MTFAMLLNHTLSGPIRPLPMDLRRCCSDFFYLCQQPCSHSCSSALVYRFHPSVFTPWFLQPFSVAKDPDFLLSTVLYFPHRPFWVLLPYFQTISQLCHFWNGFGAAAEAWTSSLGVFSLISPGFRGNVLVSQSTIPSLDAAFRGPLRSLLFSLFCCFTDFIPSLENYLQYFSAFSVLQLGFFWSSFFI